MIIVFGYWSLYQRPCRVFYLTMMKYFPGCTSPCDTIYHNSLIKCGNIPGNCSLPGTEGHFWSPVRPVVFEYAKWPPAKFPCFVCHNLQLYSPVFLQKEYP